MSDNTLDFMRNRKRASVPPRDNSLVKPATEASPKDSPPPPLEGDKLAELEQQLAAFPVIERAKNVGIDADLLAWAKQLCGSEKITLETFLEAAIARK